MKILIKNGRVIDPSSGFDQVCDLHIDAGVIRTIGAQSLNAKEPFVAEHVIDASECVVCPGLIDLTARLREPGYEHEGMLSSELHACVAGGVTTVVCPPDTDPVLDEPGIVDMLKFKTQRMNLSHVHPLGALTTGLKGESLTEMYELALAGCVGFGQAESSICNTQVLQRAMQYAATYGFCVWLRPQDYFLGQGVAASGALATRLGLSGVPVAAETIALNTIFALMRSTGARVHLCRVSSEAGVGLIKAAKEEGLPLSCDVSINSLHLTDQDIGFFDSRARLTPPLRQQKDKLALQRALADGVIDVLVSDHNPVEGDLKSLPFAQAEPGASGVELLLSLALKWGEMHQLSLLDTLKVVTSSAAKVLSDASAPLAASSEFAGSARPSLTPQGLGRIALGAPADVCVFDPSAVWSVHPEQLTSQGKFTPFAFDMSGMAMQGRVLNTLIGGRVVYSNHS
jgi:dihydroorotase